MTADEQLLARLRLIDTASLSDANRALRVLPPTIRPLTSGLKMVGQAVIANVTDDLMSVIAALNVAGPGDVLVVSAGVTEHAVAGELFGTEASRRGLAGVVIDGMSRDTAALRRLGLPFYSRGSTPRALPACTAAEIQLPVLIGDVELRPGDLLVGDDDGIILGTVAEFAAIVDAAETAQANDEKVRASIEDGMSLHDAISLAEHDGQLPARHR